MLWIVIYLEMHPFSQRGLGKTGQCSGIAPDEREAEPGTGLLGNVKRTLRGLEALGGHKDWFGRSWEGLLGRPLPEALAGSERVHWQVLKRIGLKDIIISAHQITKSLDAYLVSRMARQYLRG